MLKNMRVRLDKIRNKKAIITTFTLLFLGVSVYWLGIAEWNNLCAPKIDWHSTKMVERFSIFLIVEEYHWYCTDGAWYNTVLWMFIGLGMLVSTASGYLFWYLWKDE